MIIIFLCFYFLILQKGDVGIMNLTKREAAIMRILWSSENPMLASEIVEVDGHCTIYSIQPIIKHLIKKDLVEVCDIVYSKNVLARRFKAKQNPVAVQVGIIKTFSERIGRENLPASELISLLISDTEFIQDVEELNKIEEVIAEQKKVLLGGEKKKTGKRK